MTPSPTDPIRVLIVDDQRIFADALSAQLDLDERVEVVGIACGPVEATELAPTADVALVDLVMPAIDGIELARALRAARPGIRVVLVSGRSEAQIAAAAREVGADAFLRKGSLGAEVGDVVVEVARTR